MNYNSILQKKKSRSTSRGRHAGETANICYNLFQRHSIFFVVVYLEYWAYKTFFFFAIQVCSLKSINGGTKYLNLCTKTLIHTQFKKKTFSEFSFQMQDCANVVALEILNLLVYSKLFILLGLQMRREMSQTVGGWFLLFVFPAVICRLWTV